MQCYQSLSVLFSFRTVTSTVSQTISNGIGFSHLKFLSTHFIFVIVWLCGSVQLVCHYDLKIKYLNSNPYWSLKFLAQLLRHQRQRALLYRRHNSSGNFQFQANMFYKSMTKFRSLMIIHIVYGSTHAPKTERNEGDRRQVYFKHLLFPWFRKLY